MANSIKLEIKGGRKFLRISIPPEKNTLYASLSARYNPIGSDMRCYQLHLLDTLREFDSFCRANDIIYYLSSGTLLGAIRHKGFIPWDDDADLWMDRENYEKLEKLMQGEHNQLTENVFVVNGIRPELWSAPYAYIDIFVLDSSPESKIIRFIKERLCQFLYVMIKCRGRIDNRKFGKFKKYFILAPIAMIATGTQWKEWYRSIAKWKTNGDTLHETTGVQVYNDCVEYITFRYPSGDKIWEPIEAEFEGYNFYIPIGYDVILKLLYGDYMQIPDDIEKNNAHNINDTVGNYINKINDCTA